MEFRVLGALDVRDEGRTLELRGSKRRTVLALLVLHANEVIRSDRLIDELWGEHPPANASAALHNHVSRLRKEIGSDVIVTKPWGYVLRADPEAVDLRRFEGLLAKAKPLPARERTAKLSEALALWRGPALADLREEPALRVESARLDELRLAALEQRIDADLELGRHEELVTELEAHVGEHPLRERLRGQLILALYRSGHQAEALETYRETRRLLVEELGIEPSQDLRELERAILCQDPALGSIRRPIEPYADQPPDTRWRWPRSPLLLGAALVLTAAATTGALLIVRGGATGLNGPLLAQAAPTFDPENALAEDAATTPVETTTERLRHPPMRVRRSHKPQSHRAAIRTTTIAPSNSRRPSAPSPQPPTSKKPRVGDWVYWLADDFSAPSFDEMKWHRQVFGTGLEWSQRNGRLESSIRADADQDNVLGVEQEYWTNCFVKGDFDAAVDFDLLDWPASNGLSMTIGASFPVPHEDWLDKQWLAIARTGAVRGGNAETYATNLLGGTAPQTEDLGGSLRLARRAGILSAYYRYKKTWVKLGSQPAAGAANLVLTFSSSGRTDFWGGQAARAAFDNFRATAKSVDYRGFPLPPRKRRH